MKWAYQNEVHFSIKSSQPGVQCSQYCDVPGPGEEQESPSSRALALRADLRFGVERPAAHKEEGPKAGITDTNNKTEPDVPI